MSIETADDLKLTAQPALESAAVEVFYDGDCPLCLREIRFLQARDRKRVIRFSNLQDIDFTNSENAPSQPPLPTYEELMAEIHGRLPDGTWIKGVEVFRRLYGAIGWTWLVAITRWPLIRNALDLGYVVFARYRLFLTGRCLDSCEVKAK